MKNDFVDPKMAQGYNRTFCWIHGGSKDCFGLLHKISFRLYDADENELTDENAYLFKTKKGAELRKKIPCYSKCTIKEVELKLVEK